MAVNSLAYESKSFKKIRRAGSGADAAPVAAKALSAVTPSLRRHLVEA